MPRPRWLGGSQGPPSLDARKGVGSALGSGSQGTLRWTPPPLTLPVYCPRGTLWPRRTPGGRSPSPPERQEGPQQAHHPWPSAPPASLPFAEPEGCATKGAPPKGAHFSGGVCRGKGSSSGLKGHCHRTLAGGKLQRGAGSLLGVLAASGSRRLRCFLAGEGQWRWGAHDLGGVLSTHGGQSGTPCLSDALDRA